MSHTQATLRPHPCRTPRPHCVHTQATLHPYPCRAPRPHCIHTQATLHPHPCRTPKPHCVQTYLYVGLVRVWVLALAAHHVSALVGSLHDVIEARWLKDNGAAGGLEQLAVAFWLVWQWLGCGVV
eukprot:352158-Chlamydomonas_euryale.AAC.7